MTSCTRYSILAAALLTLAPSGARVTGPQGIDRCLPSTLHDAFFEGR
jgi:hypothetical protein